MVQTDLVINEPVALLHKEWHWTSGPAFATFIGLRRAGRNDDQHDELTQLGIGHPNLPDPARSYPTASAAGIIPGDELLTINGEALSTLRQSGGGAAEVGSAPKMLLAVDRNVQVGRRIRRELHFPIIC